MDQFLLSQAFGLATLGFKVGSLYLQSHFPDTQRMRLSIIPMHIVTAASYAFSGAPLATIAYSGAAARSALLSSEWGNKHKNLVSIFNVAAVSTATALLYETPKDLLPLAGTGVATVGDYQPQGRYNRLTYLFGRSLVWLPMALANQNWAMVTTEAVLLGLQFNAIYKHDVRDACGLKNASLGKNLHAYMYGIFHNAATGANKDGQISRDPGHAPLAAQYLELLQKKPNPHFVTQAEVLQSTLNAPNSTPK